MQTISLSTANGALNFATFPHRCQNAHVFIVEDGDQDGLAILGTDDSQFTFRSLTGSWHLHADESIIDSRPIIDAAHPFYPGAFIAAPESDLFIQKVNTTLQENVNAGDFKNQLTFADVSSFPDNTKNTIIFNFGMQNAEGPIKYNARPNNTTIIFNPAYEFKKSHQIGEVVNLSTAPKTGGEDYGGLFAGYKPRDDGSDYYAYATDPLSIPVVLSQLILQLTGAGIPVAFFSETIVYRWAEL